MNRLRGLWLLIISISAAALGLPTTMLMHAHGYRAPVLPGSAMITFTGIGVIIVVLGIMVHRDQKRAAATSEHRRGPRRLHPLQAVRVVAAAQACAYAGSLIAGWHGGVLVELSATVGFGSPNAQNAILVMCGSTLWVVIGFVVEQLCRVPPDDPDAEFSAEDYRRRRPDFGEGLSGQPGTSTRNPHG